MTTDDHVESNPHAMIGKPVIRGTRIPVELILRRLSEGASELTSSTRIRAFRATTFAPRRARPKVGRRCMLLKGST